MRSLLEKASSGRSITSCDDEQVSVMSLMGVVLPVKESRTKEEFVKNGHYLCI